MTQKLRPASDFSNDGWTTAPLFSKINGSSHDSPNVTSPVVVSLKSFVVNLDPGRVPTTGPYTLSVRLRRTSATEDAKALFALLQGSTVIRSMIIDTLTTSFATYTIVLDDADIIRITDYGNLRVKVSADQA